MATRQLDPQIFGYRFLLPTTLASRLPSYLPVIIIVVLLVNTNNRTGGHSGSGQLEWAPPNRRSERAFKHGGIIRRRTATVLLIMGTVYLLNVATIFGDKHSGDGLEKFFLLRRPPPPPSPHHGPMERQCGAHDIPVKCLWQTHSGGTPHHMATTLE